MQLKDAKSLDVVALRRPDLDEKPMELLVLADDGENPGLCWVFNLNTKDLTRFHKEHQVTPRYKFMSANEAKVGGRVYGPNNLSIEFNATPWLCQASDENIIKLDSQGWDNPLDIKAFVAGEQGPYSDIEPTVLADILKNKQARAEIYPDEAWDWIKQFRPHLVKLPKVGNKVELKREVSRDHEFIAPKGLTGTVISAEPGNIHGEGIVVQTDQQLCDTEIEEDNNIIHWPTDELSWIKEFWDDVKIIDDSNWEN